MKKSVIVLLILLCLPFFGFAQQKIEFEEFTLENGLQVILHQDNSLPLIAINIMYHVGSKNENPQRTGFAHFFEHLMFEGTKHIPRGEFDKYVERAGGTLNAGTSFDYTTYYLLLPSNELELGLWLESERLLHPVIDSTGIATQKSVVIEEKKQTQDNRPYGRILYETLKRAYTQHPYQWVVIGDENHIRDAEDHEFEEFHRMFYVPQNAVLVIAGDIQKAEARKMVEKYFADIPAGSKEIYRPIHQNPQKFRNKGCSL
jgi:zinc protease